MPLDLVSDKNEHEQFVSNLNGTSALENYYLLTLPIMLNACISFWSVNLFQLGLGDIKGSIVINFLAVCVPFICSITIFNQHLEMITGIVALLSVVAVTNSLLLSRANKYNLKMFWRVSLHEPSGCVTSQNEKIKGNGTRPSHARLLLLSQMRGLVLLVSGICIMAVDVPVFPRRFAKTEWYGLGPMDLGVGLFAAVSGLLERGPTRVHDDATNKQKKTSRGRWKSPAILVTLGLVRLLVVKVTGYPEHEGEYGRHWNFFFTLAVVRIVAIVMERFTRAYGRVVASLLVLGGLHHALLSSALPNSVATATVNHSNTTLSGMASAVWSLVQANKQGIASLPGYILLWLAGLLVAHSVAGLARAPSRRDIACLLVKLLVLPATVTLVLLLLAASSSSDSLVTMVTGSVSRRFANLPYVIWTGTSLCWCLALLLGADLVLNWLEDRANYLTRTHCPDVLCLINSRALLHFLAANLATGLANMLVNTLHLSPLASIGLVLVHTIVSILAVLFVVPPTLLGNKCCPPDRTNSRVD